MVLTAGVAAEDGAGQARKKHKHKVRLSTAHFGALADFLSLISWGTQQASQSPNKEEV